MKTLFFGLLLASTSALAGNSQHVNPFIGTSNFGATHPGAQYPNALASVSPFNVAYGDTLNKFEKDAAWNSRVYIHENGYLTGFSHLNLSGVGCPEAGVMLLMPTTGKLNLDAREYGSTYSQEQASPGYYSSMLDKYQVKAALTSTLRSGLSRFTFPAGQSHILLNLGLGLTNESGGSLKVVSEQEVEGSRMLGTFCYNPEDVRPVYFVARFSKAAAEFGAWKKMPKYQNVEADWIHYNDSIKPYPGFRQTLSGDDIGAWFSFDTSANEAIEVKLGISFVSIENARANLDAEQPGFDFAKTRQAAVDAWDKLLDRVEVEGTDTNKTLFYTALYHSLIHPNILQDINGDYPLMGQQGMGNSKRNRYTVYSLWDTNRNLHPLLSLLYPELQSDMLNSAVAMAAESGWLPKWELYGMETQVMVGDPATPMLADSYLRGIRDFDIRSAYQAMVRAAEQRQNNLLRPENADYLDLGYVPVDDEGPYDGSVSTSLEYYLADFNLAQLAGALGKTEDQQKYLSHAMNYRKLFDASTGMLRPKNRSGQWLTPYDPELGRNFEPAPGYIEGNAWNYRFYVPHDTLGLIELLGGQNNFLNALDATFDTGNFDMANEPDITYPFLYNYLDNQGWRTSLRVKQLIAEHYGNHPAGLPGNDDTGTMSAWLAFAMMGIYPVSPGVMDYALFEPSFDKITVHLNSDYYPGGSLVIESRKKNKSSNTNAQIKFQQKDLEQPFLSHQALVNGGRLVFQ
ncbi:GH92 family glycosyl hydrolase [Bowmanella yangjiangensis]|uniref:GH92 family glycosyl hydrolase n=1 Tax=Bowmanella yangjiangensis TaxID=2811230 RepID=A0ABS3CT26_9ALTE|nr:GH92 family glycosyl hydrolase [Bowmanella yangjiangensis]MBN7820266.1 GH92 family glycosyl hydrolase [Bowmanella yangjiangensis]